MADAKSFERNEVGVLASWVLVCINHGRRKRKDIGVIVYLQVSYILGVQSIMIRRHTDLEWNDPLEESNFIFIGNWRWKYMIKNLTNAVLQFFSTDDYFEIKITASGYCWTNDPIEIRNRPRLRTMWTSRVGIKKIGMLWEGKWNTNREWVGSHEFVHYGLHTREDFTTRSPYKITTPE